MSQIPLQTENQAASPGGSAAQQVADGALGAEQKDKEMYTQITFGDNDANEQPQLECGMPISNKENVDFESKVVQESPARTGGESLQQEVITRDRQNPSQGSVMSQKREKNLSQDGLENHEMIPPTILPNGQNTGMESNHIREKKDDQNLKNSGEVKQNKFQTSTLESSQDQKLEENERAGQRNSHLPLSDSQQRLQRRTSGRTRIKSAKVEGREEAARTRPIRSGRNQPNELEAPIGKQAQKFKSNSLTSGTRDRRKASGTNQDVPLGTPDDKNVKKSTSMNENEQPSKPKKSGPNQFSDTLKTYQKMFMFDWDLKDINKPNHSPKDELTTGAFWFYFNTTFFPHDLQQTVCDQTFEEWVRPTLKALNTFRLGPVAGDQILSDSSESDLIDQQQIEAPNKINKPKSSNQEPTEQDQELEKQQIEAHVHKLIGKRKKFNQYRQHYTHLTSRASKYQFDDDVMKRIQSEADEIPKISFAQADGEAETDEVIELNQTIQRKDFQKILSLAEIDLENIQNENYETLKNLFQSVSAKYEHALSLSPDDDNFKDMTLYKPQEIFKYGIEFTSYVDPRFVQDMINNKEWYSQNLNQYLLNINYPTKLQTDFLKELELSQQHRNDQKYRKILGKMDEMDQMLEREREKMQVDGDEDAFKARKKELERRLELLSNQLSTEQRAQIAQEDACCAICKDGDYEEDNQIVFCATCSIPVHQSCYGIERVPEIDWECHNCQIFRFGRGLMVKCFLCPKRGGAMKPTNIFSTYENFYEYKIKKITPKTGKNTIEKLNNKACIEQVDNIGETQPGLEQYQIYKQQTSRRYENNTSLHELLLREQGYKQKLLQEFDQQLLEIEQCEKEGTPVPELAEMSKTIKAQEDIANHQLNFNKHEKENHNTPEDYSRFIRRNEMLLEAPNAPVTDTLYHWVHHSCSMWMQGPIVTPKTPVKMNKLDFSKFAHGCIVCGKKGCNVGACVKCCKSDCQIYFHVECAKRSNYCMDFDKKNHMSNKEKVFSIYCEKHRPFKIMKEIERQNQKEIKDIENFTRTIERAIEIQNKYNLRPKKLISKAERSKLLKLAIQNKKLELLQLKKKSKLSQKPKKEKQDQKKVKKWLEKHKKQLFDGVKEKYLQITKLRLNLIRVDPMIDETKRYQKEIKRIQKQEEKRKKKETEMKRKEQLDVMMKERDQENQKRGLRNRVKNEDGQEVSVERGGESANLEKKEENKENIKMLEMDDVNTDSMNLKTEEQLNVPIFQNDAKIDTVNEVKVESHQPNNLITLDFQVDAEMEDEGAPVSDNNLDELGDIDHTENYPRQDQQGELEGPPMPVLRHLPIYYKFAQPINVQELEWAVCNSRYDFPWHNIQVEHFTAKDCYKMYQSNVTDAKSFLKEVLGGKRKFQKMMSNQLAGLPTFDQILNMSDPNSKVINHYEMKQQGKNGTTIVPEQQRSVIPGALFGIENMGPGGGHKQARDAGIIQLNNGSILNTLLYCKCRGKFQSDFMVGCENDEDNCVNGGWLHPECTADLRNMTREEIEQHVEVYYCEDCRLKDGCPQNAQFTGKIQIANAGDNMDEDLQEQRQHENPQIIINTQQQMQDGSSQKPKHENDGRKISFRLDDLVAPSQSQSTIIKSQKNPTHSQHGSQSNVRQQQQESLNSRSRGLAPDTPQSKKQKLIVSIDPKQFAQEKPQQPEPALAASQTQALAPQVARQGFGQPEEKSGLSPNHQDNLAPRSLFVTQNQGTSSSNKIGGSQASKVSQLVRPEVEALSQGRRQPNRNSDNSVKKNLKQQFQPLMTIAQQVNPTLAIKPNTSVPSSHINSSQNNSAIAPQGLMAQQQQQAQQQHQALQQQLSLLQAQAAQHSQGQTPSAPQQQEQSSQQQQQGNQQLQELLHGIHSFFQQQAQQQAYQQQKHLLNKLDTALQQTGLSQQQPQPQPPQQQVAQPAVRQQRPNISAQSQRSFTNVAQSSAFEQQIEQQFQQQLSDLFGGLTRSDNGNNRSSSHQQQAQAPQNQSQATQQQTSSQPHQLNVRELTKKLTGSIQQRPQSHQQQQIPPRSSQPASQPSHLLRPSQQATQGHADQHSVDEVMDGELTTEQIRVFLANITQNQNQ